jgi:hypothetical protein
MSDAAAGRFPKGAIAHLFRHLDDPARLEQNPIARHLFEDPKTGCLDPARARTALQELRRLVLQAAELAKDADLARNQDRQARRQYAIVTKTYLAGVPLDRVARELGISKSQVYRERSSICERIARFVWDHRFEPQHPIASGFGVRQFELERAEATAELGHAATASTILETLLQNSTSQSEKAEIASIAADVAMSCGNRQLARQNVTLTTMLLAEARSEERFDILLDLVAGRLALVTAKLRRAEGDVERARVALQRAIEIADRCASSGIEGARFFTDVALERADCLCDDGSFQAALDVVIAALSLTRPSELASPSMRAELQTRRALYALMLPRTGKGDGEHHHYLDALYESLALARSSGSPRVVIGTMIGIAVYLAYCGMHDKAHDAVQRVVGMALAFPNPRVRATSLVGAADVLCVTPYRMEALKLLNEAEHGLFEGGIERVYLDEMRSRLLLSQGAYPEAWQAGLAAEADALRLGNRRYLGVAWRTMALTAYACGRMDDATERITAAIGELESTGSPLALVNGYRAAATITGDDHWRHRAKALARQLAS